MTSQTDQVLASSPEVIELGSRASNTQSGNSGNLTAQNAPTPVRSSKHGILRRHQCFESFIRQFWKWLLEPRLNLSIGTLSLIATVIFGISAWVQPNLNQKDLDLSLWTVCIQYPDNPVSWNQWAFQEYVGPNLLWVADSRIETLSTTFGSELRWFHQASAKCSACKYLGGLWIMVVGRTAVVGTSIHKVAALTNIYGFSKSLRENTRK